MKSVLVPILLLAQIAVNAQGVVDDFSDGDFAQNPVWIGDTSSWKVEQGSLRSNNTIANSLFYLSTSSTRLKNTEWTLNVSLQFNTSSLNYVDIYLAADSTLLTTNTRNGIFVRIGGTKDEICLYKRVNGVASLLIDGQDGTTNKSANAIALKITCSDAYEWDLQRNLSGQASNYVSEGLVVDSSLRSSEWFGIIVAQSTSSFFGKHSFDGITIKAIERDIVSPQIVSVRVTSTNTIRIVFDEPVDTNWLYADTAVQFYNSFGMQLPILAIRQDSIVPFSYRFTLSDSLLEGTYTGVVKGLSDMIGNRVLNDTSFQLAYAKPKMASYKQIVITELMPDPVPSVGLPEKEYVEIYNASNSTFDLKDYTLADPSVSVRLPSYLLVPNEYLILCRNADTADFRPFGNVLPLNTMPSLNNSGDVITLSNAHGTKVDEVSYALSWYKDSQKDDGGHSLELIDPANQCLIGGNWMASRSGIGGTPGRINSVFATLKDTVAPTFTSLEVISPTVIRVLFSEKVDSLSLISSNFALYPLVVIKSVFWDKDSLDKVEIELVEPMPHRVQIQLLANSLKDCSGNIGSVISYTFGLVEAANVGDVLVNELLFNPLPNGTDLVELYNNSEKHIELKGWYLANLKDDTLANKKLLFKNSFVLEPYTYLVLTEDKNTILNHYPKASQDRIVQVSTLPTYYDDMGNVLLLDINGGVMDRFDYNEGMHSPLVPKKEGVSLEKINPTLRTNDPNNWTSAAKEAGYATPGYLNSQYIGMGVSEEDIWLEPLIITPNGDGDKDFMVLGIRSNKIENLRTIIIFDIMGREVKRLLKNGYAGTQTLVQWDGTDDQGSLLPLGHYILWLEAVDKSGNVLQHKKKVAVGAKF